MNEPFQITSQPQIDDALLIIGLEGWVDAGGSTKRALEELTRQIEFKPLAEFISEDLYDLRSRRPTMRLVDSVNTGMNWPRIRVGHGKDPLGRDVLLLRGPEPDYRWRPFARSVVSLAQRFNVRLVVGLGSYPSPAAHTRETRVVATATSEELAGKVGRVMGSLVIPAGAAAAIELACKSADLSATGLWAQIPHYAAGMSYPGGSAALISTLARIGDIELTTDSFKDEIADTNKRIDELVSNSSEAAQLVERLEAAADRFEAGAEFDIPSGDEIAAQIQDFLRDQ